MFEAHVVGPSAGRVAMLSFVARRKGVGEEEERGVAGGGWSWGSGAGSLVSSTC